MIPPNDWPIRKCLLLSIVILATLLGLIGVSAIGFDIPVLRQIVGFVFLALVPGILILRILKIHNIGLIEGLAYAVGLSLAFVMFSGALINFVLPLLSFSRPISLNSLTVSSTIFAVILMIFAYLRDKNFKSLSPVKPININWLQLMSVLFLILLLLLTILAVVLIDVYQSNILLLICLLATAGIIALASFDKFITQSIYPLAIFIISLCLLYQTSLLSPYLVGSDIYTEYHFSQLVANTGFWNASIPGTVNSCLSITMLAPIYSLIMDIQGIWIFKAIYPLLFAMVPLLLFHIFSRQMSSKKAFLAAFFFVAVPTFSLEMPSLCRQQIAELFLVLIIMLFIDRKLSLGPKLTLLGVFVPAMIVSHYALGFIGFLFISISVLLILIIRNRIIIRAWMWLTKRSGGLPRSFTEPGGLPAKALILLLAIYFVLGLVWYGTTASGVDLTLVSTIFSRQMKIIAHGVHELLTNPGGQSALLQFNQRALLIPTALGLDFGQASIQGKVFRIFQYVTELFLIVGLLRLIFKPRHLRLTAEYIALSVAGAILILACIFVPSFADLLNATRMYHLALITLAPFCILGGEAIWLGISSMRHKIRRPPPRYRSGEAETEDNQASLRFIALAVLIPYFLFTSGLVYEVTGEKVTDRIDSPYSIALSSYRLDLAGIFNLQDGAAAHWLSQNANNKVNVYVDSHGLKILRFYEFPGQMKQLPLDASKIKPNGCIYFTTWNTTQAELTYTIYLRPGLRRHYKFGDILGLGAAIESKDRIYFNGNAQILAP